MNQIDLVQELQGDRSQEEFAQLLGVTQVHVSYVLSGKRNVGHKMIRGLLCAFADRRDEIVAVFFGQESRICEDPIALEVASASVAVVAGEANTEGEAA